jgi:hypothetical protein
MQCPHCLQHFHESWNNQALSLEGTGQNWAQDAEGIWGTGVTKCPACKRIIVALGILLFSGRSGLPGWHPHPQNFRLVHPKAISRSAIPPEVPAEFAADYREACLVLADSEKASAALSRRCLQHLLREKVGVKKSDLASEIQQVLDSKQLPGYLSEDLDAIRNIGNFAAHPIKSTNTGQIVDVEPHEAEWLLNLLEQLFDLYFVQPERAQAKRNALNMKLQSAGKPPMKTS